MKKNILILLSLITFTAMAQTKGKFEVLDLKSFKLHVYYTNDALNDASYIVEGKNGLITLEQPLFKDNVAEFDAYVASLNKPVQKIISDYHVGGTGNHYSLNIFSEIPFYRLSLYIRYLHMFSFGLNTHEISRF